MNYLSRILLFPVTVLYGVVIAIWDLYWRVAPKTKLSCKVVSIGNIVAGGAGKTPLVIYAAKLAMKAGLKTAVVARGYKRRETDTVEVTNDSIWERVGDEPLEIYRAVPGVRVYISESKTEAAIRASKDGAQIIIIDDGFQHRKLARDIDIVCLDSVRPFGPGGLLPGGRLREPIWALKRADALVYTSYEKDINSISRPSGQDKYQVFYSNSKISSFKKLGDNSPRDCESISKQKSIAFCGLANPDKFRAGLSKAKITPLIFKSYDDHHRYSQFDIDFLVALSKSERADCLITTCKDAVKLDSVAFGDVPMYYAVIDIAISDETEFRKMIGL